MRSRDRWVRHEAKRPLTVHGRAASSTNPRTWSTYAAARASKVGNGLGFVLSGEDRILCVDIDHCLEDGGNLAPWAARILSDAPATYTEVSPSGAGLHVWGLGDVVRGRVVHVGPGRVEVYSNARYMTVSGQRFAGAPSELAPIGDLLASLTM